MRRLLPFVAAISVAVTANAQPLDTAIAPFEAPSLRADGYVLRSNPANVVFLDGVHSGLTIAETLDDDRRPAIGWHSAYGFGKLLGFGAGIDSVEGATAATWGLGFGSDSAALGFSSTRWFSDDIAALDGFSSTRISASWRASNVFGFGVLVDNLTTPRLGGVPVNRALVPSMAIRSANGRFNLDMRYRLVFDGDDQIGATLLTRPVDGIRLFAQTAVSTERGFDDAMVSGGIEVTVGPMSASFGAGATFDADGGTPTLMTSLEVASHGPPGFLHRDRFVRIDVGDELPESPSFSFRGAQPVFTDTIAQIYRLRDDPIVGGMYLNMSGLTSGQAQLTELRQALLDFRAADKTLVVYLERATVRDLYVAGHADVVIAAPSLSILETGVGVTQTYFAELLARFDIEAQFVRVGAYKSGPERFTETGPSAPATEQLDAYLDAVWETLRDGIADNFDIPSDDAEALLSDAPIFADALLADGHVDAVLYRDELADEIDALVGRPVSVSAYSRPEVREGYWFEPNEIAVLHISGSIVMGRSGGGLLGPRTGAQTIVDTARALAVDPNVEGVIVRVDSPGGSAEASDRIQRALTELARHKPTIVSMGDVAASGGIYVASFGVPIYTSPNTLTGSIGIYAGTVAIDGLLDRVGIHRERSTRGGPSDLFEARRWSEEEVAAVRAHIENAYETFLERIAEARSMSRDDVDAVAQGRIWSGDAALAAGLVDATTGFAGALDDVRNRTGLLDRPYTLAHYPRPRPSLHALLPDLPQMGVSTNDLDDATALLQGLGLDRIFRALAPMMLATPNAPMAHLEWELTGL